MNCNINNNNSNNNIAIVDSSGDRINSFNTSKQSFGSSRIHNFDEENPTIDQAISISSVSAVAVSALHWSGQEHNPQDAWLPITESRNGSIYSAISLVLCSGIGFQALLLPVAFATLGW